MGKLKINKVGLWGRKRPDKGRLEGIGEQPSQLLEKRNDYKNSCEGTKKSVHSNRQKRQTGKNGPKKKQNRPTKKPDWQPPPKKTGAKAASKPWGREKSHRGGPKRSRVLKSPGKMEKRSSLARRRRFVRPETATNAQRTDG